MSRIAWVLLLLSVVCMSSPLSASGAETDGAEGTHKKGIAAAPAVATCSDRALNECPAVPAAGSDIGDPAGTGNRDEKGCSTEAVVTQNLQWCCCQGCCGYATDCRVIPGCPRC